MFKAVKKNLNMVKKTYAIITTETTAKREGEKEKSRRMRMRRRKVEVGG